MTRNNLSAPRRPRIAILPYGPSDSVNALKEGLEAAGHMVVKLRKEGSTFRARQHDMVINWGNSTIPQLQVSTIAGAAPVLNAPENIRRSSDKRLSFNAMSEAGVSTVEFTTIREEAQAWVDEGSLVYARTRISGHSGEGIVMVHSDPSSIQGVGNAFEVVATLPRASLYTKGLTEQRREFRIHVMGGVVTGVQQKKRADGWRDNEAYSNVVRNYHTGWIYANADVSPNAAAIAAALAAVRSVGLDFGAVDVITRRDDAWVLEVNTAPGLQGSNLQDYVNNFSSRFTTGNFIPMAGSEPVDIIEEVESVPTPTPINPVPVERPAVHPVDEQSPNQRRSATAPVRTTVRNGAFYRATVRGERTIVQYNSDVDGYYMPGWEIPMNEGDEGFDIISREEVVV
ncbi:MAG: ATP-grasp domain-containing protein [Bacteroidales bacterium]